MDSVRDVKQKCCAFPWTTTPISLLSVPNGFRCLWNCCCSRDVERFLQVRGGPAEFSRRSLLSMFTSIALFSHLRSLEVGWCDRTEYLVVIFTKRGYSCSTAADWHDVPDVKKNRCYICGYFGKRSVKEKVSVLSDENFIAVGAERFRTRQVRDDPGGQNTRPISKTRHVESNTAHN